MNSNTNNRRIITRYGRLINCLITLVSTALFNACSLIPNTVDPSGAFKDVGENVSKRTGQEVRWVRGDRDAVEVAAAVSTLLQKPLSAESAAQIALLNNRSLQAEFEMIGIAYADYVQAGLLSNPQFTASIRWPDKPPSGINSEYSVVTNFIELLLLPYHKEIASRKVALAKLLVSGRVLELAINTKTSFYNLQARQQLLRKLKQITQTNEIAADLAKKMHEVGNVADLELANKQVAYTQSRVDVAQTQSQILSERERLNRFMGVWGVDVNWKINDELPAVPREDLPLINLEATALKHRLDVAIARVRVDTVAFSLGIKSGTRLMPTDSSIGVDTERDLEGTRVTGPTLSLGLPIFDQGQAAIARLESLYRQAQREYEAIAIDARSEVREARDLVAAKAELARYYRDLLIPQRKQVVNQTQLHYNVMGQGPFELLIAKATQLEAERAYIEALRDYWISRVQMQQALLGSSPRSFLLEQPIEGNNTNREIRP